MKFPSERAFDRWWKGEARAGIGANTYNSANAEWNAKVIWNAAFDYHERKARRKKVRK